MDFQQISEEKHMWGQPLRRFGDDVWFHHVSPQRLPVIWWALPDSPCEISRSLEHFGAIWSHSQRSAISRTPRNDPNVIPMFVFDTFRCTPNGWKMLKDWTIGWTVLTRPQNIKSFAEAKASAHRHRSAPSAELDFGGDCRCDLHATISNTHGMSGKMRKMAGTPTIEWLDKSREIKHLGIRDGMILSMQYSIILYWVCFFPTPVWIWSVLPFLLPTAQFLRWRRDAVA